MAGHSKFKNIMHRKGRADAVRSRLFSRFSRDTLIRAIGFMLAASGISLIIRALA